MTSTMPINFTRFITMGEEVKNSIGVYIGNGEPRKYLAVALKYINDTAPYVRIYDLNKMHLADKKFGDNPSHYKEFNLLADLNIFGFSHKQSRHERSMVNVNGTRLPVQLVKSDFWDQEEKVLQSLTFSSNNKYLAIVVSDLFHDQNGNLLENTADLGSTCIIYDWKNKIVKAKEHIGQLIKKMTFCPNDQNIVCTTGPKHWRLWKLNEDTFKFHNASQKLDQERIYTTHIWTKDDKLLAATSQG